MKTKNIRFPLIVLSILAVASFAFLSSAQENSSTSNNVFVDSDQDGLSDQEEKLYGTDPHNLDTDGDGYSDGAEVKSGYDPLKPAPGDKLVPNPSTETTAATSSEGQNNLTDEVAQKVFALMKDPSNTDGVSVDQVQQIVDDATNAKVSQDELPAISSDDIKIKKQNYGNLSAEKAAAKRKEDFSDYIVGLSYILSSNSPAPVTSTSDINNISGLITSQLSNALTNQNPASLNDLSSSGTKMLEQMKNLEVPEELVDIHKKGLQLARYAIDMQDKISPNNGDPLLDIANYAKMIDLVGMFSNYADEVQNKFDQYGLTYSDVQDKLQTYGINVSDDLSQKLTQ